MRLSIVKLTNHAAKGVTDKDFELAKKIEEVVMWQPGVEEDSALEGTPGRSKVLNISSTVSQPRYHSRASGNP